MADVEGQPHQLEQPISFTLAEPQPEIEPSSSYEQAKPEPVLELETKENPSTQDAAEPDVDISLICYLITRRL